MAQRKLWLKLTQDKYRRREGKFLAEGFKVVQELLRSLWTCEAILVQAERVAGYGDFLESLPPIIPVYAVSSGDWRRLSQDKNSEGIMALVRNPPPRREIMPDRAGGHLLVLHEVGNPNNLGALLRTAHWFGVRQLILSRGSVDYTNPKVVRTAMGSLFHLDLNVVGDLSEYLRQIKNDYFLVATAPAGGVHPYPCDRPAALIMGNESHGLPDHILTLAAEIWTVPGAGLAESLSLPQAAAIALYEMTRMKS